MRLTFALWGVVAVLFIAAGIQYISGTTEEGTIDVPPPPVFNPPTEPDRPPPTQDWPGPEDMPDEPVHIKNSITITDFRLDKDNLLIDVTFNVRDMRRTAIVTLPKITYDCRPPSEVNFSVQGLDNLFSELDLDLGVFVNKTALEENPPEPAEECTPVFEDNAASATYIYGFSENIVTKWKGRVIDDLTFYGIKDLNFRGTQFQDEVRVVNQIVIPPGLQPGTYSMNITIIDKLSYLQDSVVEEFII
ncbi:MAG: hypothetical protein KJ709_00135 [Nanoarchaeota archaeon]|nr:hypothetical protein [Nanoarchaeota archaeon]